jgi:hypothetical protein
MHASTAPTFHPANDLPASASTSAPSTDRRPFFTRKQRVVVGALSASIVVVVLLTLLVAGGTSGSSFATDAGESGSTGVAQSGEAGTEVLGLEAPDASSPSSTLGDALPAGGSPSGFPSGGAAGASPSAPPQLETITNIVLDPGVYERDLVLRNTGGSPLTWSATPHPGDTLSVTNGVIEAHSETVIHLTADEYSTGSKNWTHTIIVHSDGGDAQIDVQGTTLLPPMPQIVGGTQVNQFGNVYVFDNGHINVGLQIKNEGDLPLDISFATGPGGRVHIPHHQIEGGQTQFIAFSLCGHPAPLVATQVVFEVYVDAGEYGQGTLIFRFNLNAGQPTGPC